ncbi:DNA/RNA non-specific endonuclease [Pedobacter duraquae]|uniref:DNA/RNA non-specific endonuclease n=1 Tax=Pedobacter duraquae TaxID=425511 RepID=A0A4V3C2V1_9SPHI|nr:DNA/RNA non-specific endonuclease [Pedobacter duraquae]TDO19309.1 DNA/RNA non-specific endonuclease [Pedobacter duraquae]
MWMNKWKLTVGFLLFPVAMLAQTINGEYARALHRQYPSQPTDFCPSCKLWVNPYYKSIADTARHMPLLTFYIYTKAHRLEQEALKLPRSGTYAAWYPSVGQPNETALYSAANKVINRPDQPEEIQKGHCQAWILLAYTVDAAILSDTYTFNSAMEYRGQNLGTEIASEDLCRKLTGWKGNPELTDSVKIWCGTFGSQATYTKGKVTGTVPAYYYKILKYKDHLHGKEITTCYWFPNQPEETQDKLKQREVSYKQLKVNLGFDPMAVFTE